MPRVSHGKKQFISRFVFALIACALLLLLGLSHSSRPFASAEVNFTDPSAHGLAIVPASCPSNPFDTDAPFGCSSKFSPEVLCANGFPPPKGKFGQPGKIKDCPAAAAAPSGNTNANFSSQCSEVTFCSGSDLYSRDKDCNENFVQHCPIGCASGECNKAPPPVIDLSVVPLLVQSGGKVSVSWNGTNVQSCSVSGSNGDGQGWSCNGNACATTRSATSSAITAQTIYTLNCKALDGSAVAPKTAIVNIVPAFCESGAPGCQ